MLILDAVEADALDVSEAEAVVTGLAAIMAKDAGRGG